jgi:small GTP-binding protein
MSDKTELIFKLALLGNSAVGKTSLISQYIHHKFEQDYHPSLGVNITIKEMIVEEKNANVKMILWDIAGQEKYDLSRKAFFQGCVGALFVYDVTRPATFKDVESKWLKELTEFGNRNIAYLLIGNKNDLIEEKMVSTKDGENLAIKIKASEFIETSAKHGANVEKAFKALVLSVISNRAKEKLIL